LNLTINHSNTGTDVITACDSYTWIDGNTYTSSNNTATFTLTNQAGCDSVVTLNLTINHSNTGTDVITACDSYTWIDGNTYTSSNNSATFTLTNQAGCDSVVTLNLTITTIDITASVNGNVCTANQAGAGYQWLDCSNNQPIIGATSQDYTATENGNYQCVITIGNCSDTTPCLSVVGIGINFIGEYHIQLFPNPNQGVFTLKHNITGRVSVKLVNVLGELVRDYALYNSTGKFDVSDLAEGIYQVVIGSETEILEVIRMVKQ
ncbi:MAG: T9SS type A sorting domain-containing protein, partial [Chitinophagales bacterium]|nr:T9SS type A sorting domain-containing protein [Chitinophagales bacterium]